MNPLLPRLLSRSLALALDFRNVERKLKSVGGLTLFVKDQGATRERDQMSATRVSGTGTDECQWSR